jgi:hypothetical protein
MLGHFALECAISPAQLWLVTNKVNNFNNSTLASQMPNKKGEKGVSVCGYAGEQFFTGFACFLGK